MFKKGKFMFYDLRWPLNSGIGRFAKDLYEHLTPEYIPLYSKYHPTKLNSMLFKKVKKESLFYSAGFLPILGSHMQLLTLFDLINAKNPKSSKQDFYFNTLLPLLLSKGYIKLSTGTTSMAEEIGSYYSVELEEICVIPPGVSSKFELKESKPSEVKLLYVGTNKPHKNFQLIEKVIAYLPKSWTLTIVTSDLEVRKKVSGLYGVTIHFNLGEKDLVNVYRESSVLILPSIEEGFGLTALESIKCGTPVVHLGLHSVMEFAGKLGFSANWTDSPIELIECIQQALDTPFETCISESARVCEEYNWNKSAKTLELATSRLVEHSN